MLPRCMLIRAERRAGTDARPLFLRITQPRKLRIQSGDSLCRRFPQWTILRCRAFEYGWGAGQSSQALVTSKRSAAARPELAALFEGFAE